MSNTRLIRHIESPPQPSTPILGEIDWPSQPDAYPCDAQIVCHFNMLNILAACSKVGLCILPIAQIAIGKWVTQCSFLDKNSVLFCFCFCFFFNLSALLYKQLLFLCICYLPNRCSPPEWLSTAALHSHLPDRVGGLWNDSGAALLSAVCTSEQRWANQPSQSRLHCLEHTHVHLPLLLVHRWWVLKVKLNSHRGMFEVERAGLKPGFILKIGIIAWVLCMATPQDISGQHRHLCQEVTPFRLIINTHRSDAVHFNSSPECSLNS